jgi:hypothetical protein
VIKLKKETFLKKIKYRRRNWNRIIDQISERGLNTEIIQKNWYLKDVIAHISWYDKQIVDALMKRSILENKFIFMSFQDRNALIYNNSQEKTLSELLKESRTIFGKLITEIEKTR